MANVYSEYTFDKALELKMPGLVAASEDGTILDLGSGLVDAYAVIDAVAIDAASADAKYTISIEASNTADMTTGSVCVGKKVFGNLVIPMDDKLEAPERYVIPFRNEEGGNTFRYVRLSTLVEGTIATGMDFSAFIGSKT